MTPQTEKTPLWQEIVQAILAGLQIATQAVPVVQQYKGIFDVPGAVSAGLTAADAHPVTVAVVNHAIKTSSPVGTDNALNAPTLVANANTGTAPDVPPSSNVSEPPTQSPVEAALPPGSVVRPLRP